MTRTSVKYAYAYKTSDGKRHEDVATAESREAVFVMLRGRGIRPIKVVALDGSKANGEVVLRGVRKRVVAAIVVAASLVAGGLSYWIVATSRPSVKPTETEEPEIVFSSEQTQCAYTNLEAQALSICGRHRAAIGALKLDMLEDYAYIERTADTSELLDAVRRGYRAVDASRNETRSLFKTIFELFSAECDAERAAAQRLYARTMDALDVSEGRIANDEKALKLLDAHRDLWHFSNGRVEWTDAALANEFEYFRRNTASR